MNQIRSTYVISNQKHMSEGIPSLMKWKSHRLDIWAIVKSENHTTDIHKSQGPGAIVNEWIQAISKIYVFIMVSRFLQKLWYVYWHMMI